MPWQAFLLDSNASGYATALVAMATHTDAKASFTDAQVLRDASHDSTLKVVFANITEEELDGDGDLVNLRTANYPTELCRHRWADLAEFRAYGFHTLGESVRSYEGEASRSLVHVSLNGSGAADGNSCRDSIAWASLSLANGTSYLLHGKFWQDRSGALNGQSNRGIPTGGAATDAASINIYGDANLTPYLNIDGQDISQGNQFPTDLGWTSTASLFGAGSFVKANLCQPQSSVVINNVSLMLDAGGADPFDNMTTLEDSFLERVDTVGGLSSEMTFYAGGRTSSNCAAAPFGAPDAAIQDDGGAFTDLTAEIASATAADVPMFPGTAVAGDAFYVGHTEVWSAVALTMSTAGVGDYTLAYEYWNGSTWAATPSFTFHGTGTGSEEWKSTSGSAGGDPRFIFNPPDDWATTTVNSQGPFYYIRFRYASGTMSTSPVASQGQVESTFYVVHLKDGATPTTVLPGDGLGLGFGIRQSTRPGQLQLINLSMLGCSTVLGSYAGADLLPSVYRTLGGRFLYGGTGYQNGQLDEWKFGKWPRAGPWDTSDLPDYSSDADVQAHVDHFGYDPANWSADAQARKPRFRYITVGPHYSQNVSGGSSPGIPDWWPIDGLIIEKTGFAFKGISKSSNQDMHDLAVRGGLDLGTASVWDGLYLDEGHAHIYLYATSDTNQGSPIDGNNQNIGPLTIQDSIIGGLGTETPTAGLFGLRFGGDSGNGNLRDNGNGVRDITLDGISLLDFHKAGSDDVIAMAWNWDQLPTIGSKGLRFARCYKHLGAGGAGSVSKLYVVKEDSLGNFTDITTSAYGGNTNDAFTASPQVGERLWLGYKRWPFRTAIPNIVTSGVGDGLTAVWRQLESGTTLVNLSTAGSFDDATATLTAATGTRTLVFDKPGTWSQSDFGGELPTAAYWICLEITVGTYSTVPQISTVQGPRMGGYFKSTEAGKLHFEDPEGPVFGVIGLNGFYEEDRRTLIVDRFTGRLKSGDTIDTFGMFFRAAAGTDTQYTLSQVKGGSLDKSITTSEVIEDNVGRIAANVSTTPGVDIEEVA